MSKRNAYIHCAGLHSAHQKTGCNIGLKPGDYGLHYTTKSTLNKPRQI